MTILLVCFYKVYILAYLIAKTLDVMIPAIIIKSNSIQQIPKVEIWDIEFLQNTLFVNIIWSLTTLQSLDTSKPLILSVTKLFKVETAA